MCSHDRTDELEEQREALERDYTEKVARLREELEKEREEDRAKFLQEIEALRQQNMSTPTSDTENDVRCNTTYDLLQSIAYTTIPRSRATTNTGTTTSPSITDRIVVGQEEVANSIPIPHFRISSHSPSDCGGGYSYQSSVLSTTPHSSPEGEGMFRRTSIAEEQVDEETVDINIVDKQEGKRYRLDSLTEKNTGFCVVDTLGIEGGEGEEEEELRNGETEGPE